jgi:hypothetical protein
LFRLGPHMFVALRLQLFLRVFLSESSHFKLNLLLASERTYIWYEGVYNFVCGTRCTYRSSELALWNPSLSSKPSSPL